MGDPLEGAPEPLVSAPLTREGKSLVDAPGKKRIRNKNEILAPQQIPTEHEMSRAHSLFEKGLLEAFGKVNDGYSLDRVIADPDLNNELVEQCRMLGLPGDTRTWNHTLFNLRKRGRLAEVATVKRTDIDWEHCDEFLFASEIAWNTSCRKVRRAWMTSSAIRTWRASSIGSRHVSRPVSRRWNIAGRR